MKINLFTNGYYIIKYGDDFYLTHINPPDPYDDLREYEQWYNNGDVQGMGLNWHMALPQRLSVRSISEYVPLSNIQTWLNPKDPDKYDNFLSFQFDWREIMILWYRLENPRSCEDYVTILYHMIRNEYNED